MNEEIARKVLGRSIVKNGVKDWENDYLQPSSEMGYINWQKNLDYVTIDGELGAEQLEALAWWIKNKRRD